MNNLNRFTAKKLLNHFLKTEFSFAFKKKFRKKIIKSYLSNEFKHLELEETIKTIIDE
jgi:hypothetical protein